DVRGPASSCTRQPKDPSAPKRADQPTLIWAIAEKASLGNSRKYISEQADTRLQMGRKIRGTFFPELSNRERCPAGKELLDQFSKNASRRSVVKVALLKIFGTIQRQLQHPLGNGKSQR